MFYYPSELRGALRTDKLPPLLDVTQVLLRDAELLSKLNLRHLLSLAHGFDQSAERQLPDQTLQELHRVAFLLSTHGDAPRPLSRFLLRFPQLHRLHAIFCLGRWPFARRGYP